MARYRIEVKIKAEVEYTVEVDAGSEGEAEDKATGMWREKTPDDFQVAKGYITDWDVEDTEQLTADCERCGIEYPLLDDGGKAAAEWINSVKHPDAIQPWKEDYAFCAPCGALIEAEEKAEAEAKAGKK